MPKLAKKFVVGASTAAAAVLTLSAPAFAAHTVTPNSNLNDGDAVTVAFSGLPAFATATIEQCNNDQGLAFNVLEDCAFLDYLPSNADATGAGSDTYIVRKQPTGFLDGDVNWKCDASGAVDGSVTVAGPTGPVRVFSTCRLRVVSGDPNGTDNQSFQNITFAAVAPTTTAAPTTTIVDPGTPVVPESPYAALLPIGAVAVLGGGYLIVRNRKPALRG